MRSAIAEKYQADLVKVKEYLSQDKQWPWICCQMNIHESRAKRMKITMAKGITMPRTRNLSPEFFTDDKVAGK